MPLTRPVHDTSGWLLAIVLSTLVGSFVVATIIVDVTSREIETSSERIVDETMPRIERLASVRGTTLEVELALSQYLAGAGQEAGRAVLDGALEALRRDVQGHLEARTLRDRWSLRDELHAAFVRFDAGVSRVREAADAGDPARAKQILTTVVFPSGARLMAAAIEDIELSAEHGRRLASQIHEDRRRGIALSYLLAGACVALGLIGGLMIRRQVRHRRALIDTYARALETRADELEQFAGRVAHDIRSPVSAAMMATELIQKRTQDDYLHRQAARAKRSLQRASDITDGLLEFARAGAAPETGARADVREVVADLVGGLRPEAERANISLVVEPVPAVLAGCSTGVYLSLASNLVRNAIKYMGDSTTRRVTVRVSEHGSTVRTEVIDTGPGIAAATLGSVFEPYFRASTSGQGGLGLGLATVKRLAEGHRGSVGVRSRPGEGTTFWFDLPRAGAPWNSVSADDDTPDSVPAQQG